MDRRNFLKSVGASAVLGASGVALSANSYAGAMPFNEIAGYAGKYANHGAINSSYKDAYRQSVIHIQWKLSLKADGIYGPNTEGAVRTWQKNHKLKATGVFDQQTARSLGMVWRSSPNMNA